MSSDGNIHDRKRVKTKERFHCSNKLHRCINFRKMNHIILIVLFYWAYIYFQNFTHISLSLTPILFSSFFVHAIPTSSPTSAPTSAPTSLPTSAPTAPTSLPTSAPTVQTSLPTSAPTAPTAQPTAQPTLTHIDYGNSTHYCNILYSYFVQNLDDDRRRLEIEKTGSMDINDYYFQGGLSAYIDEYNNQKYYKHSQLYPISRQKDMDIEYDIEMENVGLFDKYKAKHMHVANARTPIRRLDGDGFIDVGNDYKVENEELKSIGVAEDSSTILSQDSPENKVIVKTKEERERETGSWFKQTPTNDNYKLWYRILMTRNNVTYYRKCECVKNLFVSNYSDVIESITQDAYTDLYNNLTTQSGDFYKSLYSNLFDDLYDELYADLYYHLYKAIKPKDYGVYYYCYDLCDAMDDGRITAVGTNLLSQSQPSTNCPNCTQSCYDLCNCTTLAPTYAPGKYSLISLFYWDI